MSDGNIGTVIGNFSLGEKTCEIIKIHKPDEIFVSGHILLSRGREFKASMTENDFRYFWEHRREVPLKYCDRSYFLFPEFLCVCNRVRVVHRLTGVWDDCIEWFSYDWDDRVLLIRLS